MKISLIILSISFVLSSCATIKEWGDKAMFWKDDEPTAQKQPKSEDDLPTRTVEKEDGKFVRGITPREMELKQAKIWARLDELENELRVHRAHIKVLEKGMKLGIVPPELLSGSFPVEKPRRTKPMKREKTRSQPEKANTMTAQSMEEIPSGSKDEYRKTITKAESHFRAGHYGKAISEYEKVGKYFAAHDKEQSHRYWVALCWYRLKEFDVAKDEFAQFQKASKGSPWLPRAEYYIARINAEKGMIQSALKGFRGIVKKYPYDDTSEMAKMEIERIEQRL